MDWSDLTAGHRIKVVCELKGWTLEELARRAGESKFTVMHVAAGRQPGHVELWRTLAKTLGVRLGWLLEGEGEVWREKTPTKTEKAAEAEAPAAVPELALRPVSVFHKRKRGT